MKIGPGHIADGSAHFLMRSPSIDLKSGPHEFAAGSIRMRRSLYVPLARKVMLLEHLSCRRFHEATPLLIDIVARFTPYDLAFTRYLTDPRFRPQAARSTRR